MIEPLQSRLVRAQEAWGADLPDWVEVLARAVDETSQNAVARKLGYSPATVSTVIGGEYQASTARIEERVRGIFMRQEVACPVLGPIPTQDCQDWRKKARNFAGHNPMRVRMARACRTCPLNKSGGA